MKKFKTLLALSACMLLSGSLSAQDETWDIFDKSVWDEVNSNTAVNYQWGTVPVTGTKDNNVKNNEALKTAFLNFITQYPDFVRLQKPSFSNSGSFYINPNVNNTTSGTFYDAVKTAGISYTIELKIQVNEQAEATKEGNEIRVRLPGSLFQFFIKYNDGNGTIHLGNDATGDNVLTEPLDVTVSHVYRIEYDATKASGGYDVYIDNAVTPSFTTSRASGGNAMLVLGGGNLLSCNMDVYYVRMKTKDSPTWDILDKNMGGMAVAKGGSISSDASITKATDGIDYMNVKKEGNTADSGKAFYLTTTSYSPTADHDYNNRIGTGVIVDGEAYTVEVKARIPEGSNSDAQSQIGVRLFTNKSMSILLSDGKVFAPKVKLTGVEADPDQTVTTIATSDWHNYRLVFSADKASYNVYVDNNLLFEDLPTLSPSGGDGVNLIKFGAESWAECDMDVASVKMGTGAFIPAQTAISPVSVSGSDPVISTRYYDLLGKPVTQPQRSTIYIVKELRQSGKVTISKLCESRVE
jgi:hypothetical protein